MIGSRALTSSRRGPEGPPQPLGAGSHGRRSEVLEALFVAGMDQSLRGLDWCTCIDVRVRIALCGWDASLALHHPAPSTSTWLIPGSSTSSRLRGRISSFRTPTLSFGSTGRASTSSVPIITLTSPMTCAHSR